MEDPLSTILLIVFLIVVRGVFSLIEAAFVFSRKAWIRTQFAGNVPFFLPTIKALLLFMVIVAGATLGWCTIYLARFHWVIVLAGMFIGIVLIILISDTVPRRLASFGPEKIISIVHPFVTFIAIIGKLWSKQNVIPVTMTQDELRDALLEGEQSGIVQSRERTMVEGVFYLGDRPVNTFMTHRSEVIWLDSAAGPDIVQKIAYTYKEQRYFPVARGELDAVVGVVSVQELLFALLKKNWPGLKTIMHTPYFVPETLPAIKAFEAFKKCDTDFLLVMDEYGGFAGVLSVRALIEEIVGELSVPAPEDQAFIQQDDGSWLVDGSANIDELATVLNLEIQGGEHREYHTVAGLVLELSGEIPKTGTRFQYNGYWFKVMEMDGNRIGRLLISPLNSNAWNVEW
jgi:putative hemolysin